MKKNTTFIFILLLSFVSNSQNCTTALQIPFYENFEGSTSFPTCWVTENTDGINPVWAINNSTDINQDGTIDKFATVFATSVFQPDKNDWLFSPLLTFTSGTNYIVNIKYNSYNIGNVTADQAFSLYIVDSAVSNATTKISIGNYYNITQNGVLQASNGTDLISLAFNTGASFTPSVSGDYRVAIHANKVGNSAPLFVFSVEVTTTASVENFNSDNISHFYNTITKSLELDSKSFEMNSIEIFNFIGQIVKVYSIENTNYSANLTDLENGIYIAKVKINDNIKTIKFIKN